MKEILFLLCLMIGIFTAYFFFDKIIESVQEENGTKMLIYITAECASIIGGWEGISYILSSI